jgi:hypothetical protein
MIRFGLVAECSATPLPMETIVGSLKTLRLRLCHVSEWNIFLQVCSVQKHAIALSSRKSISMFSMFKSKQNYEFTTSFFSFEGDIPFNPPRIIGNYSSFNIRVQDLSNWSEPIDPLNASYSIGGSGYISVNESIPSAEDQPNPDRYYDLGTTYVCI